MKRAKYIFGFAFVVWALLQLTGCDTIRSFGMHSIPPKHPQYERP
jgi:hypothetical protein